MAEPEELGAAAAEYVLGTLDAAERRAFMGRLAREPLAVEAVRDWQERLAPLALALDPIEPPATLFPRIEASLGQKDVAPPSAANDNRVLRWRWATAAAALVALVATGMALRAPETRVVTAPLPVRMASFSGEVAALSAGGSEPALLVTYDRKSGKLKLLPINLPEDAKHSFELWAIQGKAAPVSRGVIDPRHPTQQGAAPAMMKDVVLAISQEPRGGSPTGLPTGPVLFTGKLVDVPTI